MQVIQEKSLILHAKKSQKILLSGLTIAGTKESQK